jgi:hypothetical protein
MKLFLTETALPLTVFAIGFFAVCFVVSFVVINTL